jgi:hypothetical protein
MAKPRRIHPYGIHFQGFRYLDTTLAAYVGEDVIIGYDPRDMAEQWVSGGTYISECHSGRSKRPVRCG